MVVAFVVLCFVAVVVHMMTHGRRGRRWRGP